MKDQSSYNTAPGPFNLLLIGEPFSGKTTLAMTFPNPGIVDCDLKAQNAIAFHKARNPAFTFKLVTIDTDDDGKHVEEVARWPRFLTQCDELIKDAWVKTIILDSGTKISTYLTDYLVVQTSNVKAPLVAGMHIMSESHWYPYNTLIERLISKILACGKNVILTVHLRNEANEGFRPAMPGASGKNLGKMFTNYWMCKALACNPDAHYPRGARYLVQSAPDGRLALGSSLPNLPAEFEFKWESFKQYVPWLDGGAK